MLELLEVARAAEGRIVEALELGLVPVARQANLPGPGSRRVRELLHKRAESLPIHFRELRGVEVGEALDGKALRLEMLERLLRMRGTDAGHELQHAKARHAVARILDPAQHRQQVFDVRGLEELEAAVFHERNVAPDELDLEHVAVMGAAEQHRVAAQ